MEERAEVVGHRGDNSLLFILVRTCVRVFDLPPVFHSQMFANRYKSVSSARGLFAAKKGHTTTPLHEPFFFLFWPIQTQMNICFIFNFL